MPRTLTSTNRDCIAHALWSTSSFGSPAHTSPTELVALGEHLSRCNALRGGALFGLRRAAEALNDFAAPRVMTTLALFAVLTVIASLSF